MRSQSGIGVASDDSSKPTCPTTLGGIFVLLSRGARHPIDIGQLVPS